MKKGFLCLIISFLFIGNAVASLAGDNIIISEVEYNTVTPPGTDQKNEWFELYNPTNTPIDISGWTFTDGEGVVTIPALTPAIASGGYFVLTHTATGGFLTQYPLVAVDLEYGAIDVGSLFMANGGDELSISDAGATLVDTVSWGGLPRFNISALEGSSIARATSADSDTEGGWSSDTAPTPGTGALTLTAPDVDDFVITVKSDNPGTSATTEFTIPTTGGGYNYNVDCDNDGINEATAVAGNYTCDYATSSAGVGAGTYTIRIKDNTGLKVGFPRIYFNNGGDKDKITGINQWGTGKWTSMVSAFSGASNLNDAGGFATDTPDLSTVDYLDSMFYAAATFNQDIGGWNMSGVQGARGMFYGASAFNQDLNNWNTSNIENMDDMFRDATDFNGNISNWNTSNVVNMTNMFYGASVFNQDISFKAGLGVGGGDAWDVSSVTSMSGMLRGLGSFNQNIGNWDTGDLTNTQNMFKDATSFDQDLSSWDVSLLTNATSMFNGVTLSTTNYDALLNGWNAQVLKNGVVFDGGNSKYCLGEVARTNMIDAGADNWTITDGGLNCAGINMAPTDIQIDTDTQDENTAINSDIGVLTTTDPDGADTHTYTLSCAVAGVDDAHFNISGDKLRNTTIFDFETPVDANADGIYEVCIRTTDNGAPNKAYDETITITVNNLDETPPPTPALAPDLQNEADTGSSNTDNVTSDDTPSFDIECTEIGSTITLYTNNPIANTAAGTHICIGVGTETLTGNTVPVGTHHFSYTEIDISGNEGNTSPEVIVTIDTVHPVAPTITNPTGGSTTSDTTPTIAGTGEIGTTINMTDGNGHTCATTVGIGGTWSCDIDPPLNNGDTPTFSVTQKDPAGNISIPSTVSLTVDTSGPATPTCTTTPTPANNGTSVTTTCTNVEIGATLTIPNMSCTPNPATTTTVVCTGIIGYGSGSIQTNNDAVTVIDGAGNTNASGTTGLTIDNEAPNPPTITTPVIGELVGLNPTVTGVCEAGSTVSIASADLTPNPNTAACSGAGTYSIPVVINPSSTAVTLSVTQIDGGGNTSVATTISVEVDTDGDGVPNYVENQGANNGDGDGDGVLDSTQQNVSGAINPVTGNYSTLKATGQCTFITENAFIAESSLAASDPTAEYPVGLVDFKVQCTNPGESSNVTIYYSQQYDTSNWKYKKYNSVTGNVYADITNIVTFGTAVVGANTVTTASFTVTDGDPATDEDGVADGIINDPSGPAITSTLSTGSGSIATASGGSAPTRHVVHMCSYETGKCENIFPTRSKGNQAFQTYEDCYKKGRDSGINCAKKWALSVGYAEPKSLIHKVAPKRTITKIKESITSFFTPKIINESKHIIDISDKEISCPERQFVRYPERRGRGIPNRKLFTDVNSNHPAYQALIDLAEQEIVTGDADTGNARLDETLNRAEFVKLITIAREDTIKTGSCMKRSTFQDVKSGKWYYDFVQNMQTQNIVEGYPDGYYRPGKDINFAEAYKIMAVSFGYTTVKDAANQAQAENLKWYQPYQQVLEDAGVLPQQLWVSDIDTGRKAASLKITRGKAFQILSHILKQVDKR